MTTTPPWAIAELEGLDRLEAVRIVLDHVRIGACPPYPAMIGDLAELLRIAERFLRVARDSEEAGVS